MLRLAKGSIGKVKQSCMARSIYRCTQAVEGKRVTPTDGLTLAKLAIAKHVAPKRKPAAVHHETK